jgi:hypothetical protein
MSSFASADVANRICRKNTWTCCFGQEYWPAFLLLSGLAAGAKFTIVKKAALKRLITSAGGEQIFRLSQVEQSGLSMKRWSRLGLPDWVKDLIFIMPEMILQTLSVSGGRIEYDTI